MNQFLFPTSHITGGPVQTVTAFRVGAEHPIYSTNSLHPNFEDILAGLRTGDDAVWDLFNVKDGVLNRFYQISDRYSWDGDQICFDGDPLHSTFSDLLARTLEQGDVRDYTAVARFGEKLATNPNEHSRDQAYDWLACHKFQITEDGDVVGYKGVSLANDEYRSQGYEFMSVRRSEARGKPSGFVNGRPVPELSNVPQNIGDTVSMPRSEVVHSPNMSCSRGLHVSTRVFAESWGSGGAVLEVHLNPQSIVSVPNGSGGEKVRTHKYKIARVAAQKGNDHDRAVLRSDTEHIWTGDVGHRV